MADSGLRGTLDRFRQGEWDSLEGWHFQALAPPFTVYYAAREFFENRGQVLAANLAFTTALSLVPLLSVATAILALFGTFDGESASVRSFLEMAFPAVASEAARYLHEFAQTSATTVGGVSALVLMLVGIFLFAEMESTFNVVWGAVKNRRFFRRVINFYFVVTMGPLLMSLSVGVSARAQFFLNRMGLTVGFLSTVLPFALAFLLFTLMHRLLPNTKVKWSAAIVGGLFTAVAFEWGKWGFNLYVSEVIFESYRSIYGALGLFPIFLLWIYVSWILVILGAELAYSVQHLRTLVEVDAAQMRLPERQKQYIFNPLVGLEVLAPVVRHFKEGQGTIPENDLIRLLGYNEVFLRSVVATLSDLGAVKTVEDPDSGERGVIPARSLDDISLLPIAEHFFDVSQANSLPMNQLTAGYRDLMRQALGGKDALALVPMNNAMMRSLESDPWQPAPQDAPVTPAPPKDEPVQEFPEAPGDYDLPPEVAEEDEPYREATFIDIPDIPVADDEIEPPPALSKAQQPEMTPKMDAPEAISARSLTDTIPGEQVAAEEEPVEAPEVPEALSASVSEISVPAIPISDDLVIEESEAFDEDAVDGAEPDELVDPEIVLEADDDDVPEVISGQDVDVSVEIDLGDDWDEFDINDALSDASAADSNPPPKLKKKDDLRETAEVDLEIDHGLDDM